MKNCISSELTARIVSSPSAMVSELAERAVKQEKTISRHMVRMKISRLTPMKSFRLFQCSVARADQ